jgi:sugar lactone lactonase YvrE
VRRSLAAGIVLALAAGPARAAEPRADLAVEELEAVALTYGHFYEGGFQRPSGVTCDARTREMYVADTGRGLVGIFDERAAPVFAFADPGRMLSPLKAIPDAQGRIIVLDATDRRRLRLYSYRGEFLRFLELEGTAEQPELAISAIALDGDGSLFVGDSGNGEVLVFDKRGRLSFRFGNKGKGPGELSSIMGIAPTPETIVVSDSQGLAVQVFDRRGRYLRSWGRHEPGRANVSFPFGLAVDGKGRIALTDSLRHEIKLFEPGGRLIDLFGGMGTRPGEVLYPADASFDGQGRLCVADRGNNRVQILSLREPAPRPQGAAAAREGEEPRH